MGPSMRVGPVVVAALTVIVAVSGSIGAHPTEGCSAPPCPPFPARIVIDLGQGDGRPTVGTDDLPTELPGTVTWRYDVDRYGPFVWEPGDRPEVRLRIEFAPSWLDATVEPETFPVELSPTSIRGDASDPTDPQARYVHRENITLSLDAGEPPADPPEGQDRWNPGLAARSTESGTVAASHGYKGFAIAPASPDTQTDDPGRATVPGFEAWAAVAVAVGASLARRRPRCRP